MVNAINEFDKFHSHHHRDNGHDHSHEHGHHNNNKHDHHHGHHHGNETMKLKVINLPLINDVYNKSSNQTNIQNTVLRPTAGNFKNSQTKSSLHDKNRT